MRLCIFEWDCVMCLCLWMYLSLWCVEVRILQFRIIHSLSNSKLNCYNLRWLVKDYVRLWMYNIYGVVCLCVFKYSDCLMICDDYMIGWQGREFQVWLWQSVLREIWASWGVWIFSSAYYSRYNLKSFLVLV